MFWRALSLRSRLLFLVVAGLLSVGLFSSFQAFKSIQTRQSLLKNDFKARAILASQAVSAAFHERYMDVQSFAANSVFQSQNRDAISQALNEYVSAYRTYDAIVFLDSEGKFVASNSKTFDGKPLDTKNLEGRSFAETTWFQRAIKGDYLEDKADGLTGSVVDDIQVDPLTTALFAGTHFGMSFSRAVLSTDGRVVGVLTARASLRFIENELRGSFDALQVSGMTSGEIHLVNKEGLLLTEISNLSVTERGENRRNFDKILRWNLATQQGQMAAMEAVAGRSGALIEIDRADRVERLWGYDAIKSQRFLEQLGWSVIVSAAVDEVFYDVIHNRRWFFAVFVVLLFVFGLFGYGFARNISKEISDYSVKMREECSQLTEFSEGIDEAFRKASALQSETGVLAKAISDVSRDVFSQQHNGSETLSETANRLREYQIKSALNDQAFQRVSLEMTLAKTSVEQLSFLEKELQKACTTLNIFSDLIYRVELLSYNSVIEAQRAGIHGKGFSRIASEIESIAQSASLLHQELSDGLQASQAKANELVSSIRRSVGDGEALVTETRTSMMQIQNEFSAIAETIELARSVMTEKEEALHRIFDSVVQLEGATGRSSALLAELRRGSLDIRVQGEKLDELIQELGSLVKGQRSRSRSRRVHASAHSSPSMNQQLDLPPDQVRADVVDRLAQKMRPRLVVKSDDAEPNMTDTEQDNSVPRRAG